MLKPTQRDIEEQSAEAAAVACEDGTSKYPGMSYEEGVYGALDWVLGKTDSKPMDE